MSFSGGFSCDLLFHLLRNPSPSPGDSLFSSGWKVEILKCSNLLFDESCMEKLILWTASKDIFPLWVFCKEHLWVLIIFLGVSSLLSLFGFSVFFWIRGESLAVNLFAISWGIWLKRNIRIFKGVNN